MILLLNKNAEVFGSAYLGMWLDQLNILAANLRQRFTGTSNARNESEVRASPYLVKHVLLSIKWRCACFYFLTGNMCIVKLM